VLLFALCVATVAHAAPAPEPTGAHPRIVLDAELRAAWRADSKTPASPVAHAIALCTSAGTTHDHDHALYQGSEWAKVLQACLVAWAATDSPAHRDTALKFFTALLDDLDLVGDGKGGDAAARRDDGFAIRMLGPYTAIAYDWLHDAMSPALRAHARKRWAAWLAWYREHGYRAHDPGNNYHAGYLASATLVAIAQGGEGGEEGGAALWALVRDELWAHDMTAAFAPGAILDGGDWPEGVQYGPLATAEYALAARAGRTAGLPVPDVAPWLEAVLRRHVYALTPTDRIWAGGDTEDEQAFPSPGALNLYAIALGDAPAATRRFAKGELARLKLSDDDWSLYGALASLGDSPQQLARAAWPLWYRTVATQTIFSRTRWDARAIWFVAECAPGLEADHRHPSAGNFALVRGADPIVVDPSPYGSLSTLTSNAPSVLAKALPPTYQPSQAYWGKRVGWDWSTQTTDGVLAARCDYSDAFRFQEKPSEIGEALRDFVLLPSADGSDAALVIVDRASGPLSLRFRIPGSLSIDGGIARASLGASSLLLSAGGSVTSPVGKDCFVEGIDRGKCTAARIPVSELRDDPPGNRATHVLVARSSSAKDPAWSFLPPLTGWDAVHVTSPRDAVVVWSASSHPPAALTYRAPAGPRVLHAILDAPGAAKTASLSASLSGTDCLVTVTAGGDAPLPLLATLDATCAIAAAVPAPGAAGTDSIASRPHVAESRHGCCDAGAGSSSPPLAALVLLALRRRRRSPRSRSRRT
jgi:hypothetical protein